MADFEFTDPHNAFLQSTQVEVEFNDNEMASRLHFEPSLGSLALRQDDELRLVLFRGQVPDSASQPQARQLLNRCPEEVGIRNTALGRGLYLGNSPSSVGVFATKESGREIAVYLTPAISKKDRIILASRDDDFTTRARTFNKEMKHYTKGLLTPHHKRLQAIEQSYGDHTLVVLDMHVGTRTAQKLQMQPFTHPIRPLWYLWRNMDSQFTRIGTASRQLSLQPWLQKMSQRSKKPN